VHLAKEIRVSDWRSRRGARAAVDHLHEENEREQHSDPDEQALGPGIAGLLVLVVHRSSFRGKTLRLKIGSSASITMQALGSGERGRPEMGRKCSAGAFGDCFRLQIRNE